LNAANAAARKGGAQERPVLTRQDAGQRGAQGVSMDKIFIRALKTEAIIGIFDWERQVKQTLIIDIEIGADVRKAALSDSIKDTLNYRRVAKRVLSFVEASQFHLVETLAEHIAMLILEEFGIAWVGIVLSKPGAVRSSRDVGVALERDRSRLDEWRAASRTAP
jgi:dihydroneopterin aldolase